MSRYFSAPLSHLIRWIMSVCAHTDFQNKRDFFLLFYFFWSLEKYQRWKNEVQEASFFAGCEVGKEPAGLNQKRTLWWLLLYLWVKDFDFDSVNCTSILKPPKSSF